VAGNATGANGSAFPASAMTACAVTQTGVWSLEREYRTCPSGAISERR
jgi:hypothetical protein